MNQLDNVMSNKFKEGDYIVTLDVKYGAWGCARKNYCFKQRVDNEGIYPVVDLEGSKTNGHLGMSFDKKQYLKDWRYATPEEIAEYDRIGKPYDVTTLQKKEESIPEYVECIKSLSNQKIGDIEKTSEVPKWTSGWSKESFWGKYYPSHYKPSTKESYEAQYKELTKKELTKKDLIEGEIYFYDNR